VNSWLIALAIEFGVALLSLRWFGAWHLGRYSVLMSEMRCHGDAVRDSWGDIDKRVFDSQATCVRKHAANCWREDHDPKFRDRTLSSGFAIVGLSLLWPVLIWAFLALRVTPPTTLGLKAENERQQEEIDRLEAKLKVGNDE
jgi:hypothetical protein